ncbi:RRM domain-containing protein [Cryptosporidium canis]|uniref:RRM domain-containing protein n=1 Tax=Cryptosporidium canis TaxID=195482 RepID=A0ABQ8P3H6_9CRYT|nr:RRM domain-containing protein [Cryptosporidium canis]KAJ1606854.1 RRM domain-containing protein [Cryptosporidium canis]
MTNQNSNKKDETQKTRYNGLGLSNQGRGVIKSQSLAFQNSKWSNVNSKSKDLGFDSNVLPGMTTVYVGRIPYQVTNAHIRKLLSECGTILRWSRQEDPITKRLSSFGLCEFDSPEGVINAVNVLNGLKISGGVLLVKYQHGIDKEMARWQSNRINEMLKRRGGDCTIETILNELSVTDSKLRISVQRLLAGMSAEFDSEQEDNASRESPAKGSGSASSEKFGRRALGPSSEGAVSGPHPHDCGVPASFPQNPKEKLRLRRSREESHGLEKRLEKIDEELYELVRLFPEKMDISSGLASRFFLETLQESYHHFKFISSSNKGMYDLISQTICSDRQLMGSVADDSHSDSDFSSQGGHAEAASPLHDQDRSGTHPSEGAGHSGVSSKDQDSYFGADAKISINLPTPSKKEHVRNPMEALGDFDSAGKVGDLTSIPSSAGLAELGGFVNSKEEVFSAENWKIILKSTQFEDYREYVEQEMRRIIGESDQNALETITNFVVEKFSSQRSIQETINLLIQILDTEAQPFLYGLFLKILEG